MESSGCNINRGVYSSSNELALEVIETRRLLANLFSVPDPQTVIFTPGLTYSLNMLLQGFLCKGDHVICSGMEHNSVMRPLETLLGQGVSYDIAPCDANGLLDPAQLASLIKKETRAVVMVHASNVCGTVMPLDEVSAVCAHHKLRLIVDAAQTAGLLPIDARKVDALAFPGHKKLLGPQGIGGFIIKKDFADQIKSVILGGTGSRSDEFTQPDALPDKFESGTLNIPAIIGLKAALEYLQEQGIDTLYQKEMLLANSFISRMRERSDVVVIADAREGSLTKVATVSLDFPLHDNAAIATSLDQDYGIMVRCGLHCAPLAHKTLGTYPQGTVRFSFGHYNTLAEIDYLAYALGSILERGRGE